MPTVSQARKRLQAGFLLPAKTSPGECGAGPNQNDGAERSESRQDFARPAGGFTGVNKARPRPKFSARVLLGERLTFQHRAGVRIE